MRRIGQLRRRTSGTPHRTPSSHATRRVLMRIWCAALLVVMGSVVGALPRQTALAFDTYWHTVATRIAMQSNGFSADARLATQVENYLTDFLSVLDLQHAYGLLPRSQTANLATGVQGADIEDLARTHFDDIFTEADLEHQWSQLKANTVASLRTYATKNTGSFRPIVLFTILGASMHTVQDFYSHSNWVNVFTTAHPGRSVPAWYDVSLGQRRSLDLYTGAYPNGCCPGHVDHAVLSKDNSQTPLNAEAVNVATRASVQWVKTLMQDRAIPWAALTSYAVDPVVGHHFLYDLDASFLTSTSILARHWDGAASTHHVFNPATEKAQALQAALLVVSGYASSLALKGNRYHLPTPYWSGFFVYHIERDLSRGLLPLRSYRYGSI